MTAGSASVSPMYQLARTKHHSSTPTLPSSASRSPMIVTTMPGTSSHHPVSSRISEIPTYSVLAQESGDRRWRRMVVAFFVINVFATSAMFAVGLWRLSEVEGIEIAGYIQSNTDSPDTERPSSSSHPAIRHSLHYNSATISAENTCTYEMKYALVAGWTTSALGDIASSTREITYNSSESCFRVQSQGNYIIYNQLTFGCPLSPKSTPSGPSSVTNSCPRTLMYYSQGLYIKDQHDRETKHELEDTWQGVQPLVSDSDKICRTSKLFGMVKLLAGSAVCVRATPECLVRSREGQTYFGMYKV